jgi:hypothetical protein
MDRLDRARISPKGMKLDWPDDDSPYPLDALGPLGGGRRPLGRPGGGPTSTIPPDPAGGVPEIEPGRTARAAAGTSTRRWPR